MMILYHGSQYLIEKPFYGGGRAANDYGRGFYCTESEPLAEVPVGPHLRMGPCCCESYRQH